MRPLQRADLEDLVDLHRQGFGERAPRADLRAFLSDAFFDHPWVDDNLPSLAYVGDAGRIVGCLGVMPRPMRMGNRSIRAVVTHNFIVAPGQRAGLTAIQLMGAMIAAEPDLTLSDGNHTARQISEALGGRVISSRSGRWFRVLRPAGLAAHLLGARMDGWRGAIPLTRILARLASLPDAIIRLWPGSPTRFGGHVQPDDPLTAPRLVDLLDQQASAISLGPVYALDSAAWLLRTLSGTRQDQELRTGVVGSERKAVGWYVYYSRPGGVGRVLQLGGPKADRGRVLQHLFTDAAQCGNVGLSGQSDPGWTEAFRGASCVLRPGRTWFIAHASTPDVLDALDGPDAFLSRLEGEGWLHFGY